MRYQRPMIIERQPLVGLLVVKSDVAPSDVHIKENIVPVAWATPYESPAIVSREVIQGLLNISDVQKGN